MLETYHETMKSERQQLLYNIPEFHVMSQQGSS
jgi:hypothetical protein